MKCAARWGLALEGEVPDSPAASAAPMAPPSTQRLCAPTVQRTANQPSPGWHAPTWKRSAHRIRTAMPNAQRRRRQRRSRSTSAEDADAGEEARSIPPSTTTLQSWECSAISLYRSVRSHLQGQVSGGGSAARAPPLPLTQAHFLSLVLRSVASDVRPAAAQSSQVTGSVPSAWNADAAFLLSCFLQTNVLTSATVVSSAKECAVWLSRAAMNVPSPDVSSVAAQETTDVGDGIGAFLLAITRALLSCGRLHGARLTARWLLEVFLHMVSGPGVDSTGRADHTRDDHSFQSRHWQLARHISDCVYGLQDAHVNEPAGAVDCATASVNGVAELCILSAEVYVCVLDRALAEWRCGVVCDSGTVAPITSAEAMLKLCVLMRQHPHFVSPGSVSSCDGANASADSAAPLAASLPVDRILGMREAWRCVQHESLEHASLARSGPIAMAVTLSALLEV